MAYFTGRLLLQRDWTVDEVWWRPPQDGVEEWAVEQAEHLVLRVHKAVTPLVVAKSLGTLATVAETSPAAAASVDGANHRLEVPDTQASVGVLARVLTKVAARLDVLTASAEANDQ